jgi:hypothetical protein
MALPCLDALYLLRMDTVGTFATIQSQSTTLLLLQCPTHWSPTGFRVLVPRISHASSAKVRHGNFAANNVAVLLVLTFVYFPYRSL